ncbi:hypothetical protein CVS40_9941 [Lucilia cuprina]|nr:hypothetical protein CVS40_9941 [Lucilia cuprina]
MKNKTSGKSPHETTILLFTKRYFAKQDLTSKTKTNKRSIRQRTFHPHKYKVDELVLAENEPQSSGMSRKLEPRYKGPFIVSKVLDKDRYIIEDLPNSKRTTRHYSSVYASDKLKPCWELPPTFDDDTEYDSPDDESEDALNAG